MSSQKVIAIGPKGGKIVGYKNGDIKRPIYAGSQEAINLALQAAEEPIKESKAATMADAALENWGVRIVEQDGNRFATIVRSKDTTVSEAILSAALIDLGLLFGPARVIKDKNGIEHLASRVSKDLVDYTSWPKATKANQDFAATLFVSQQVTKLKASDGQVAYVKKDGDKYAVVQPKNFKSATGKTLDQPTVIYTDSISEALYIVDPGKVNLPSEFVNVFPSKDFGLLSMVIKDPKNPPKIDSLHLTAKEMVDAPHIASNLSVDLTTEKASIKTQEFLKELKDFSETSFPAKLDPGYAHFEWEKFQTPEDAPKDAFFNYSAPIIDVCPEGMDSLDLGLDAMGPFGKSFLLPSTSPANWSVEFTEKFVQGMAGSEALSKFDNPLKMALSIYKAVHDLTSWPIYMDPFDMAQKEGFRIEDLFSQIRPVYQDGEIDGFYLSGPVFTPDVYGEDGSYNRSAYYVDSFGVLSRINQVPQSGDSLSFDQEHIFSSAISSIANTIPSSFIDNLVFGEDFSTNTDLGSATVKLDPDDPASFGQKQIYVDSWIEDSGLQYVSFDDDGGFESSVVTTNMQLGIDILLDRRQDFYLNQEKKDQDEVSETPTPISETSKETATLKPEYAAYSPSPQLPKPWPVPIGPAAKVPSWDYFGIKAKQNVVKKVIDKDGNPWAVYLQANFDLDFTGPSGIPMDVHCEPMWAGSEGSQNWLDPLDAFALLNEDFDPEQFAPSSIGLTSSVKIGSFFDTWWSGLPVVVDPLGGTSLDNVPQSTTVVATKEPEKKFSPTEIANYEAENPSGSVLVSSLPPEEIDTQIGGMMATGANISKVLDAVQASTFKWHISHEGQEYVGNLNKWCQSGKYAKPLVKELGNPQEWSANPNVSILVDSSGCWTLTFEGKIWNFTPATNGNQTGLPAEMVASMGLDTSSIPKLVEPGVPNDLHDPEEDAPEIPQTAKLVTAKAASILLKDHLKTGDFKPESVIEGWNTVVYEDSGQNFHSVPKKDLDPSSLKAFSLVSTLEHGLEADIGLSGKKNFWKYGDFKKVTNEYGINTNVPMVAVSGTVGKEIKPESFGLLKDLVFGGIEPDMLESILQLDAPVIGSISFGTGPDLSSVLPEQLASPLAASNSADQPEKFPPSVGAAYEFLDKMSKGEFSGKIESLSITSTKGEFGSEDGGFISLHLEFQSEEGSQTVNLLLPHSNDFAAEGIKEKILDDWNKAVDEADEPAPMETAPVPPPEPVKEPVKAVLTPNLTGALVDFLSTANGSSLQFKSWSKDSSSDQSKKWPASVLLNSLTETPGAEASIVQTESGAVQISIDYQDGTPGWIFQTHYGKKTTKQALLALAVSAEVTTEEAEILSTTASSTMAKQIAEHIPVPVVAPANAPAPKPSGAETKSLKDFLKNNGFSISYDGALEVPKKIKGPNGWSTAKEEDGSNVMATHDVVAIKADKSAIMKGELLMLAAGLPTKFPSPDFQMVHKLQVPNEAGWKHHLVMQKGLADVANLTLSTDTSPEELVSEQGVPSFCVSEAQAMGSAYSGMVSLTAHTTNDDIGVVAGEKLYAVIGEGIVSLFSESGAKVYSSDLPPGALQDADGSQPNLLRQVFKKYLGFKGLDGQSWTNFIDVLHVGTITPPPVDQKILDWAAKNVGQKIQEKIWSGDMKLGSAMSSGDVGAGTVVSVPLTEEPWSLHAVFGEQGVVEAVFDASGEQTDVDIFAKAGVSTISDLVSKVGQQNVFGLTFQPKPKGNAKTSKTGTLTTVTGEAISSSKMSLEESQKECEKPMSSFGEHPDGDKLMCLSGSSCGDATVLAMKSGKTKKFRRVKIPVGPALAGILKSIDVDGMVSKRPGAFTWDPSENRFVPTKINSHPKLSPGAYKKATNRTFNRFKVGKNTMYIATSHGDTTMILDVPESQSKKSLRSIVKDSMKEAVGMSSALKVFEGAAKEDLDIDALCDLFAPVSKEESDAYTAMCAISKHSSSSSKKIAQDHINRVREEILKDKDTLDYAVTAVMSGASDPYTGFEGSLSYAVKSQISGGFAANNTTFADAKGFGFLGEFVDALADKKASHGPDFGWGDLQHIIQHADTGVYQFLVPQQAINKQKKFADRNVLVHAIHSSLSGSSADETKFVPSILISGAKHARDREDLLGMPTQNGTSLDRDVELGDGNKIFTVPGGKQAYSSWGSTQLGLSYLTGYEIGARVTAGDGYGNPVKFMDMDSPLETHEHFVSQTKVGTSAQPLLDGIDMTHVVKIGLTNAFSTNQKAEIFPESQNGSEDLYGANKYTISADAKENNNESDI